MLKKTFSTIGTTIKHPLKHPLKFAAVVGGGYLLVDLLISDKGKSQLAKLSNMVLPKGAPRRAPAALPAPAAAAAGYYAGGPFGPGWGRGNMNYMYGPAGRAQGGGWIETPADVSVAHRSWAAASGQYPEFWTQSFYPWA
jgi:hypothetical protein